MRKIQLIVFILGVLNAGLFIFSNAQAMIDDENTSNSKQYASGELIVKLKEGKTLEDIKELNAKYNITSAEKVFKETTDPNLGNAYLLTIGPSTDILSMAKDYSVNPNVEYANPNYIAETQIVPPGPLINPKMIMSYLAKLEMSYSKVAIMPIFKGGHYGRKGHYHGYTGRIKGFIRNT